MRSRSAQLACPAALLLAFAVVGLPAAALQSESYDSLSDRELASVGVGAVVPGVSDLTTARPEAIEIDAITEALFVPSGSQVDPAAPPRLRLPVFLTFESTRLQPEARALLGRVASALVSPELEPFRFSIEGHTDDVGPKDSNVRLSRDRAAAVKALLVDRGVSRDRMEVVGHGEARPIGSNQTREGRQRNRRVDIVNLGLRP